MTSASKPTDRHSDAHESEEDNTQPEKGMVPPVEPGLMILSSDNLVTITHARRATEINLITGGDKLGLPLPRAAKLRAMHTGPLREYRTVAAAIQAAGDSNVYLEHLSERKQFDPTTSEGVSIIKQRLAEGRDQWLTIELHTDSITNDHRRGLAEIRASAKQAGAGVAIFVYARDGLPCDLAEEADECAQIIECEDEPLCLAAFSFEWAGLSVLGASSALPILCVSLIKHQKYAVEYVPYVSDSFQDRVTAALRSHGLTQEQIGELLGHDKSTIARRLKDLPKLRAPVPKFVLARYARALSIDLTQLKSLLELKAQDKQ